MRLRADLLEEQVLQALANVLRHTELDEASIESQIRERQRSIQSDLVDITALEAEKVEVKNKYRRVCSEMASQDVGPLGRELFKQEAATHEARHAELERRIKEASSARPEKKLDAKAIVSALKGQMVNIEQKLSSYPPQMVRRLLEVFVGRMTLDHRTKEIEVEFRVPGWAVRDGLTLIDDSCLVPDLVHRASNQTNPFNDLVLGTFHCQERRVPFKYGTQPCTSCTRLAA